MAEGSPDSVNLHPPSKLSSREDIDLEDQESSPVAEPSEEMLPLDSTQSEGSFGHLVVSFSFPIKTLKLLFNLNFRTLLAQVKTEVASFYSREC
jgi:hypothetical protein